MNSDVEKKWQKKWKEDAVFVPKVSDAEKYFVTVPYPYGNSALHIGHGRMNANADILARYARLCGKNVLFPMGFHISGTPVLAVADGIARGNQEQIDLTKKAIAEYEQDTQKQDALIASFKDPMNIAHFFSSKIEETFDSVGLSIDWTRQFTTGDLAYQKFITWQYHKLKDAGILVQGKYPILFSPQDENAVGEDDVKDGDLDKVSVQEMTYITFKLSDQDAYLVAATLRPDSLFGATNLYVKPSMALIKIKVGDQTWIVSQASVAKIKHQFENVEVMSSHTGDEFVGKSVIVPLTQKEVPVHPMEYPDEHHGTGIVYSSPADSPHDYIYLFELTFPGKSLESFDEDPLKLTPITKTFDKKKQEIQYQSGIPAFDKLKKFKIFNVEGNDQKLEDAKEELYKEAHYGAIMINCMEFDGTPLKNNTGAKKVQQKLIEQNLGGVFYETSRRAFTRAGDRVIVANLHGQWFLDYSNPDIKQKAYDLLESMTYRPEQLKETQKGLLKWVEKRPCARKRGLGTPLPFDKEWIIEPLSDSTIYQMYYLIANYVNTKQIEGNDLSLEFFDYVLLGKGDAPSQVASTIRKDVEYWKSFDLRLTASAHMSNHLAFLIYHYAIIFEPEYQPKNITIGGLLIKDGNKISKSKGNGIPLTQVSKKYGVDTYRLYCALAATYDAEMDFRDDEVHQLQKRFVKWKDLMQQSLDVTPLADPTGVDAWLVSRFYSRAKQYFALMDEVKMREAYVSVLYEFLNEINYHQRRTSSEQTLGVLHSIFKDYLLLMAPVTPHACEELNALSGSKQYISVEKFSTDCDAHINKEAENIEDIGQNLLTTIPAIQQRKKMDKLSTITLVQAKNERYTLFSDLKDLLRETRDFKVIMKSLMEKYPEEKKFIQGFVPKTLSQGLSFTMSKDEESQYLTSLTPFLEATFGCTVIVSDLESTSDYKGNVIPGAPGIILS